MGFLDYKIICYVLALATYVTAIQSRCPLSYAPCIRQRLNDDCGVTGKWKNQLNSTMELCCDHGTLLGKYNSAVGRAEDYYVLSGRYTVRGEDCIMGWSIAYNNAANGNSNSTASWVGIHYAEERKIYTQWLLARHQQREGFWQTFHTNQDTFERVC